MIEASPEDNKSIQHRHAGSKLFQVIERFYRNSGLDVSFKIPHTWARYPPMILLNSTDSKWRDLLSHGQQVCLYQTILQTLEGTCLAIKGHISPDDPMRKPHIIPLYGYFGQETSDKFEDHLWVNCMQNGVYQTWAPLKTMFSRLNVKEKYRVISQFKSLKDQIVVDLYAGIGYFAFAYLAAGAKRVYCWDINPFSVEGLRRGAAHNSFTFALNDTNADVHIIAYNEDNSNAGHRLANTDTLVTHVNLGLLPTSEGSWPTAAKILRRDIGGYIHIHINQNLQNVESWAETTRDKFESMLGHWKVTIHHIERVKQFAPRVWHIVLDLECRPLTTTY